MDTYVIQPIQDEIVVTVIDQDVAVSLVEPILAASAITSPVANSVFTGNSQLFVWNNLNINEYNMLIGTAPGLSDIGGFNTITGETSVNATMLPVNGSTIYVRLRSKIGSIWLFNDYTYTAFKEPII